MWTVKDACSRVVTLLLLAGAQLESWTLPLELHERPDRTVARISDDDLIDFHEALERLPTAGCISLEPVEVSSAGNTVID